VPNSESVSSLRLELEHAIRAGRCAYCRRPASPETPLTREHVIPRAKGGSRKDARIIVPACARCNQRRGCRELVVFLLLRPRRISAFLDYLSTLSPESIRLMDVRVFAELYAAVWMLNESVDQGVHWRIHLKRLCSGRTLHRRRYAARRVVGGANGRLESLRARGAALTGPSCLIPLGGTIENGPRLEEPLEQISSRLLGILALAWQASAEEVRREMERQHERSDERVSEMVREERRDGVVSLDGWRRRPRRRRLRVDRRGGRRMGATRRGRAA
jgi:hypothetical protein